MHGVWCKTIAENYPAQRLRSDYLCDWKDVSAKAPFMKGRWWDNNLYAILEEQEWRTEYKEHRSS
jgi:hypothetical protein